MANTDDPEDVELATYQQLRRIADALETLVEEVASVAASLHGLNNDGIVVYEGAQP